MRFPAPLTTDRIDVSFPRVRQATVVSDTGQLATLPVRLSQLSVPALAGLRAVTPDQQARFPLACGQGPALTVDGRAYPTSVGGAFGERFPGPPVCSPDGTLSFGAGRHTLTAAAPGTFRRHRPQPGRWPGGADRNRVQRRPRREARPQLATGESAGSASAREPPPTW